MKKALIINAHQFYEGLSSGGLNQIMVETITKELQASGYEVEQTEIERWYDIEAEVRKHIESDVIILQSPVFWFGMPWIYKKYVDEVFTSAMMQGEFITSDGRSRENPNLQYGTGGKLQGKQYMLSLTWNAPREAFDDESQFLFEGKSVDDVFISNTATYKFCGANIVPTFSSHDVMKQPDIENDLVRLREHLKQLSVSHALKEHIA